MSRSKCHIDSLRDIGISSRKVTAASSALSLATRGTIAGEGASAERPMEVFYQDWAREPFGNSG
jgi:hypothetical protein